MSRDTALPPPDQASLYQAALTHLARYSTTELGLRQVLRRRVDRWARLQPDQATAAPVVAAARQLIEAVVARLVQAGAVNDTAFAASRTHGYQRSGQSKRSIQMRLLAKGVAPEIARAAATHDADTELAAALVLARKRRIGPFRATEDSGIAVRIKEMALLARAGFSRDVAQQALATAREDAEQRIINLRR